MILAALLTLALPQAVFPGPAGEIGPTVPVSAGAVAEPPEALSEAAPARDPFTPESVFTIRSGPRVVRLPAPGSPLIAMRVSVPVDESQNEAGAGRLLETLASQRVQGRAAVLGLHFEGSRTPWGVAYTVAGSRSELADLVALLRDALAEPDMPDTEFERRRRGLWEEVLRTTETPAARLLTELRVRAAPGNPATQGTPTTLERMTRATVREVWARTHRPEAMTVVVSGDVTDAELTTSFQDLAAPRGPLGGRAGGPIPAAGNRGTQVFRHWLAQGFRVSEPGDPHGSVVALLAADWLRRTPASYEAEVQLIQLENIQLLAVVSAAYAGEAAAMRERMPRLLASTRQSLSANGVESAVLRVRQELFQQARTPPGLVSVVGRHLDETGDPSAAVRYLAALARVSVQSTSAFISGLERQAPIRAEVRP
jgi:hypothetical protein